MDDDPADADDAISSQDNMEVKALRTKDGLTQGDPLSTCLFRVKILPGLYLQTSKSQVRAPAGLDLTKQPLLASI